ncbi:hypothetical protein ACM01_15420 [Streptomyces viridochromogenes]|uniref:Uncharacterized protein n=1 Tax=Streptomyces viridochromogenes TaxID=1938 RepID=A0A0J7ZGI1_STRVR|nr:hypothetical protein [Streptomyces viridochromogenes]KMS74283.1 hypothetical protein ACM01_15420 [Streptomyces viridochromogenes]
MSGQLRPWTPEDFDDRCETCDAPPGQLCRPWCDTGYTAADARRDAELRGQATTNRPASAPVDHPSD